LQEILHRCRSIQLWDEGRKLYDLARSIFPVVIPVDSDILDEARRMMDQHPVLLAWDAVHAAVLFQHRLDGICS